MANKKFPRLYKATTNGDAQVWEISVFERRGVPHIRSVFGLKNGKKQEVEEPITVGKNIGKQNETTPFEQAVKEAQARWERQISRNAYGETLEASEAVRWAGPMLAQVFDKHKQKVDWSTAFAQPKLDGFRLLAKKTLKGVVLVSRENQPMSALTDLQKLIEEVWAKGDFGSDTFDGEAYCHGLSLNQVASACKRKSDLTAKIQFHVYDCILPSAPFKERSERAQAFVQLAASTSIHAVATVKVRTEAELMTCQRDFVSSGYEGAMLRHGNSGYQAGKRADTLLKVKTFFDGEFEIVDWKPGRGKFAAVPIFTCKTDAGHVFDVTAPGDMTTKAELGANAAACVGKKMTVKYQYFTKTDTPVPFLPVAIGLREHK